MMKDGEDIGGRLCLRQGHPLDGRAIPVKDRSGAERLYDLICRKSRHLPVIIVSEVNRNLWTLTPTPPHYLLDANALACRATGHAHVAQMTYEGAREWSQLLGHTWAVYDGAVKIFRPNFDLHYGNASDHPAFFKGEIWNCRYDRESGTKAFFNQLLTLLRRHSATVSIDWSGILFYNELRIGKEVLRKVAFELRTQLATETAAKERLAEKLHHLSDQSETIASMQQSIEHLTGFETPLPAENGIEIPDTYADLSAWVQIYLAGRLALHPRAERTVEKAEYKDPRLVYRALLALAFEYRDSRLGLTGEKPFKLKCSELGIQKRRSITKFRAAEEGGQYFVNHPVGTPNRHLLQFHLTKGNSRKKLYCMRIYFFWDDESKQVIVGHLPGHLDNRIT